MSILRKNIVISKKTALLIVVLINLTGCASIVNGVNQSVSVETPPTTGAQCTLSNNKGKWFVNTTPGSVTVHRSYEPLNIECKKSGYEDTTKKVSSTTKGMAFGNVLFGGLVGGGVDMADGAAYDYPATISVPMKSDN